MEQNNSLKKRDYLEKFKITIKHFIRAKEKINVKLKNKEYGIG